MQPFSFFSSSVIIYLYIAYLYPRKREEITDKMKKQILLIAILFCTAFAQAQEVFVTADFVSSYIWRGMDSGNASVQPSLGLNWKGLTVYAWGSTEFREKNNEIDLSLEYEYKKLTLYANNYFTQTEELSLIHI